MNRNSLNKGNLALAGWLAVLTAVLAIPLIVLQSIAGIAAVSGGPLFFLLILFNIGYTAVYVYILVMLRRLLNEQASFDGVDTYITLIIWFNIAFAAIGILTSPGAQGIEVVALALLILLGIVYVVFGIKLLKHCADDLFGLRRLFSYLTIATGIMTASVVLLVFAVITGIISHIVLARIFLKAAKHLKIQGSLGA